MSEWWRQSLLPRLGEHLYVYLGSSDPPPGYQGASTRYLLQDRMAGAGIHPTPAHLTYSAKQEVKWMQSSPKSRTWALGTSPARQEGTWSLTTGHSMVWDSEGVLLNSRLQGTRISLSLGYLLAFHHKRGSGSSVLSWTMHYQGSAPPAALISRGEPKQDLWFNLGHPPQPSCSPSMKWLWTRLLFQEINEGALNHLQKQRRITKELFFLVAKEENLQTPTVQLLQGIFPTKMNSLPRK